FLIFFFFQAEDGIRDATVTGVQTCALPICWERQPPPAAVTSCAKGIEGCAPGRVTLIAAAAWAKSMASVTVRPAASAAEKPPMKIGRASCRERVEIAVGAVE